MLREVVKERREGKRKRHFHDVVVKGKSSAVRLTAVQSLSVAGETQDISFRGLCIELSEPQEAWNTGASVKINLKIGLSRIELPARVRWKNGKRIGVKVFLELLDQSSRERYLRWIAK